MTATTQTTAGPDARRLLAAIADLSSAAGARILEIAAAGIAPRTKADRTPVTAADEAAETILCEGLARLLPGVPIVAEEAAAAQWPSIPRGNYLLVDPIDGTRELIAGRREYTVNVALVDACRPAFGLIYAPALDLLYAGTRNAAWRVALKPGDRFSPQRTEPIRARPRPARLTAMVSRSHPDPDGDAFLARLPIERRTPLGSSLKFARLAEGSADVYVRLFAVNEWDVAAGHAILDAAGGQVISPDGEPIVYGRPDADFRINGFVAWGGRAGL